MDAIIVTGIVLGTIALIAVSIIAVQRAAKRRTEGLRAAAEAMNFTFSPKADRSTIDRLTHFHLFSQGRTKRISNVLRGAAGDLDVWVFDYAYTTGGGQHSRRWVQTVILFQSDEMRLPKFALRPENLFHKIGQVFGYRDIDFGSHPAFSKRYLVRGEDEDEIRSLFTTETLDFYEADRKLSTEAAGGQLIHYRAAKTVRPQDIQAFITQGVRVLTLLRSRR